MTAIYHSKKLFYKEWTHKVRLIMPTGYNQYMRKLLGYKRDKTVRNKLNSLIKSIKEQGTNPKGYILDGSEEQLDAMYNFIFYARKNKLRDHSRINEYWRIITVYTNNEKFVKEIADKFDVIVEYIEMPASKEEMEIMQEKKNTTIVNRLPYNKYRYSCKIDYWSNRNDPNICSAFIPWAETYGKRIKISSKFGFGHGITAFRKFWVEDKKLLNMVQLYLGRHITKVESYKLRSEISNENKDN